MEVTFGELKSSTRKFASGLKSIGFKPGEVLAIVSPNHIHFPIALLGTIAFGGTVTTPNPNYKVEELRYQLSDSKASIIVAHSSTLPTVLKAANNVDIPTSKIFVLDKEEVSEDGIRTFTSLYKDDDDSAIIHYTTEEKVKSTVAYLCYSSGTTGKRKGVETTHYNMVANLEQIHHFEEFNSDLPFYHIFALNMMIHQVLYCGATAIVLSVPDYDIDLICQAIQDHKINLGYIVPSIVLQLVNNPVVDKYDLSSLNFFLSGAAPLCKKLSKKFNDKFEKIPLKQGYGLTEATPIITLARTDDVVIGSSGLIVANVEIKFIGESEIELGINEEGEICARGPNIMKGSQVAPAELESILLENPIISEAAVVGVYSEQDATELPVAYVVLKNSTASDHQQIKKSIQDYVAEKVISYKRLRGGVYIIDKLPKNDIGKILRKDLRERIKSEWEQHLHSLAKEDLGKGYLAVWLDGSKARDENN
ncbi:16411_t:CDS:2 [Entrophospora sp. SA101]|nr:19131_t:CDS:2 [Entrophospora sp. SA101]CAJ0751017.1 7364_t:CDS:2 [Entrophospora sp. SA101]CAJ0754901.1 16411_t:CDS:2 [Entrophospora sp. SA101]